MMKHSDITGRIIAGFFSVYNTLGYGFLEKVYHNSLMIDLPKRGLYCNSKAKLDVWFDGTIVGEYFPDILVHESVIVEIKAAEAIAPEHQAQLLNYLKASGIEVGLFLNFGPKAEFKRMILDRSPSRIGSA